MNITKDFMNYPHNSKVQTVKFNCLQIYFLEYKKEKSNLKFIKISFETPTFDKVTKDRAATFVDQLSAIGGTMGLLTGFSIISGVEIVNFAVKILIGYFSKIKADSKEK